jgi:hypothetical protein
MMLDGTEFLECSCGSDEHTLRFILSMDEDEPEIYTTVHLGSYPRGWKRVWIGIRYIFGYKSKYGAWDCFLMKAADAERLQFMLQRLINCVANREAAARESAAK